MDEKNDGKGWLFDEIIAKNGSRSWVDHVFCSNKILGIVSGTILDSINGRFTKNEFLLETNEFVVLLAGDGALEEIASAVNEDDADHLLRGEWEAISFNLSFGPGSRHRYRLVKLINLIEERAGKNTIRVPLLARLMLYVLGFPAKPCECGHCNGGTTLDIDEKIFFNICAETAGRIDETPGMSIDEDYHVMLDDGDPPSKKREKGGMYV